MQIIPLTSLHLNRSGLRSLSPVLLTLALLFIAAGCSTYQNITGYFNTYYNAKKLYTEAVNEVEFNAQKSRDTLYFSAYKIGPGSEQKFDKVIEKCSKIIQSYEKSGWVDDAILMIGVSYVYKSENESAERKFRELTENFPQSDLRRQAKMWYAKSEYFMGKQESALKLTSELFDDARSEGDNDVLFELLMLDAQIATERGEYDVAAQKYTLASQASVSDDLRSRAEYQLGLTYEKLNNWSEAADAYREVRDFHPPFPLEFQSRLKYGKMLTLAHQYDKALAVLDDLFDEQLRVDERSLVDLEIANTHWARGDSADAFALYTLIDTTYARTDASAKASYQRGMIYENSFLDFKNAKEFYNKAKDQFATSEIVPQSQKKAATLAEYFRHYQDITKFDSLFTQRVYRDSVSGANNSDSLFAAATHADSLTGTGAKASADSSVRYSPGKNIAKGLTRADSVVAVRIDSAGVLPPQHPLAALPDSLSQAVVDAPDENIDRDDDQTEGRHHNKFATGRSTIRNDARSDAMSADPRKAAAPKGRLKQNDKAALMDTASTKQAVPAQVSQAALPADSLKSLLAQAKFELGGVLLLQMQRPDSALFWFRKVVKEHPNCAIMPRTLYSMAEIYRSRGDSTAVDSIYNVLISRYENSEYAHQAKKILGLASDSTQRDTVLPEFQVASEQLQAGKPAEAIRSLEQITNRHTSSQYRAKSMYMIGWIYENSLVKNDSAAAWYRMLVKEYPSSVYAADVQARLAVKTDPKSLSQYVKIREIVPLQPVKADRTRARAKKPQDQENQDDEEIRGRRNHQGDPDDENTDDEDEPDEDVDDNNFP